MNTLIVFIIVDLYIRERNQNIEVHQFEILPISNKDIDWREASFCVSKE
jgi:hypothetical protein